MNQQIKTIGKNGQLSLGKKYAGSVVMLIENEPGVITLNFGEFIPVSERWMHKSGTVKKIEDALHWAEVARPFDKASSG
jgi:hypothetical protein